MTNIELWLLNTETIKDSFKEKEPSCKSEKCPGEGKPVFCSHFNKIYHSKWREILKDDN